jgi:hypothetical protein
MDAVLLNARIDAVYAACQKLNNEMWRSPSLSPAQKGTMRGPLVAIKSAVSNAHTMGTRIKNEERRDAGHA